MTDEPTRAPSPDAAPEPTPAPSPEARRTSDTVVFSGPITDFLAEAARRRWQDGRSGADVVDRAGVAKLFSAASRTRPPGSRP